MRPRRAGRAGARVAARRIPITVMLDPENHAFLESCSSIKEFDSVDKFFNAALVYYRKHLRALTAYADAQREKGYTRAEILASIECETVVTKSVVPRPIRRR